MNGDRLGNGNVPPVYLVVLDVWLFDKCGQVIKNLDDLWVRPQKLETFVVYRKVRDLVEIPFYDVDIMKSERLFLFGVSES